MILVVIRLVLVSITLAFPEGAALIDSRGYMDLASSLVYDGSYDDLNWPPGYAFFIALASGWSTPSFVGVTATQLVLTSLTALLLVPIGESIANKRAGLMAGWLYALSPNAALWAITVMTESLYASLLVVGVGVWILARKDFKWGRYLALGICLGCGALVRIVNLPLIPIWTVLGVLPLISKRQSKRVMIAVVSIGLGVSALILPWSVHNLVVHGKFTFTEETSRTFYTFNIATVLAEVDGTNRGEAAHKLAQTEDPFQETLNLIAQHPATFIREQAKGIMRSTLGVATGAWGRLLGFPLEMQGSLNLLGDLLSGRFSSLAARVQNLLQLPETAVLLVLSLLGIGHTLTLYVLASGIILRRGGDYPTVGLLIITAAFLLVSPGAVGQARFRIPAEPLLALLAGIGWDNYRTWVKDRQCARRERRINPSG